MDERQRDFIETFRGFLDTINAERRDIETLTPLGELIQAHIGRAVETLPTVTENLPEHRLVDADIALAKVAEQGRLIGVSGGRHREMESLPGLLSSPHFQYREGPVDFRELATGPDSKRQVVGFGIWLFTFDESPVAVLQRAANPQFGQENATLDLIAPEPETSGRLLDRIRELMHRHSVLRGQVVSFAPSQHYDGPGGANFRDRPQVTADEVILPAGVLDRIVDHVIGIGDHRDGLRAAGQHLKRGLLLYGPPGTGKTHTVRHLIGHAADATVVLLTGPSMRFIGEAVDLARGLQPAMVVLEDVDLIAEDRDDYGPQPLLFTILDALDGLDGDADVAFLLTTNRVESLERALAQRPGRVDLAVEIGLPDLDDRLRLFQLYAAGLGLSDDALAAAADKAAGTTASFAKELMRRTVLRAVEHDHPVTDDDLAASLDTLLSDQETLTRALLGSDDDRPARPVPVVHPGLLPPSEC